MATIRAVSFDLHGTLILPDPSIGALYADEASRHGLTHTAAELDRRFSPAFARVAAESAVPYGADQDDARRFWDAVIDATFGCTVDDALHRALFQRFARGVSWRILPGAREALATVAQRGLPCYLCSNFDQRVHSIIDELALGPFDGVLTSAELGAAKPSPDMLERACALAGCASDELLHIGDKASEDAEACRAAGCAWLHCEHAGLDGAALSAVLDGRRPATLSAESKP